MSFLTLVLCTGCPVPQQRGDGKYIRVTEPTTNSRYHLYLPVDYVKIDGSFVKDLMEDDVSHAMVTSINHVSHRMGLKTVAEFVENDTILAELAKMRVDYLQGYASAEPVPIMECLRTIEQRNSTIAGKGA